MTTYMYRIEWISLLTNHGGHGSWSERKVTKEEIDELNKRHKGVIKHWIGKE